jgi:hypothetical protein
MYSLQADDMLGSQLAQALYEAYLRDHNLNNVELNLRLNSLGFNAYIANISQRISIESVTLSFSNIEVTEYAQIAALYEIEEYEITCERKEVCIIEDPCDELLPDCAYVCNVHPPDPCTPCPQDCILPYLGHVCELDDCVPALCSGFSAHVCDVDANCTDSGCPYEGHVCSVGSDVNNCVAPCHVCIPPCVKTCDKEHHDCVFGLGVPCVEEWRSYHECEFVGYSPRAFIIHPSCNYPADDCDTLVTCDRCHNSSFPHGCSGSDEGGKFSGSVKLFTFTTPRTPRTYSIFATMVVTIEIMVNEGFISERTITSQATYSYAGGELSDCMRYAPLALRPDNYDIFECAGALPPPPNVKTLPAGKVAHCCMKMGIFSTLDRYSDPVMNFTPGGFGAWRLEKYENIESLG